MGEVGDFHKEILEAYSVSERTGVPLRLITRGLDSGYMLFDAYMATQILSGPLKDLESLGQLYYKIHQPDNRDTDAVQTGAGAVLIAYSAISNILEKFAANFEEEGDAQDIEFLLDLFIGDDDFSLAGVNERIRSAAELEFDLTPEELREVLDPAYSELINREDYVTLRVSHLMYMAEIISMLMEHGFEDTYNSVDELGRASMSYIDTDDLVGYKMLMRTPTCSVDESYLTDENLHNIRAVVKKLGRGSLKFEVIKDLYNNITVEEWLYNALIAEDMKGEDLEHYRALVSPDHAAKIALQYHRQTIDINDTSSIFDIAGYVKRYNNVPYKLPAEFALGIIRSYLARDINVVSVASTLWSVVTNGALFNYLDLNSLEGTIREWKSQDKGITENPIIDSIRAINSVGSGDIMVSGHSPTNASTRFNLKFRDRSIKKSDGLEIFDLSETSQETLHIIYVDSEGNERSKIYTGTVDGKKPDYETVLNKKKIEKLTNHIYLVVWTRTFRTSVISNIPKASLFVADLDLTRGYLDVESLHRKEGDTIMDTIVSVKKSLSFMEMDKGRIVISRGSFRIYGLTNYREESLFDMALNDPVLKLWITVPEDQHTVAVKNSKQLSFVYASPLAGGKDGTNIKINAKKRISSETVNEPVYTSDSDSQLEVEIDEGTKYLLCTYSTNSKTSIVSLLKSLPSVIEYYKANEYSYNLKYDTIYEILGIRNTETEWVSDTYRTARERESNERLSRLMDVDQDLFGDNYTEYCSRERQPVHVPISKVKKWKKMKVAGSKKGPNRTVISINHNYYGCDKEAYPYIGLRTGKDGNRSKYIPCCFETPQNGEVINASDRRVGKKVNVIKSRLVEAFEKGEGAQSSKNQGKSLTVERYSLSDATYARLPVDLSIILREYKYDVKDGRTTYKYDSPARVGVQKSPSSVIHSILNTIVPEGSPAWNDGVRDVDTLNVPENPKIKGNYKLHDPISREEYVEQVRILMAKHTHPNLLSQEMFNYTEEDKIKGLGDVDSYLDPHLYINALEEYFKINLYFFTQGSEKTGTDSGSMLIPYHLNYYSKPYRKHLPVVLMMVTKRTAKRDKIEGDYQCESIVMMDKTKMLPMKKLWLSMEGKNEAAKIAAFNEEMVGLWDYSYRTLTWGERPYENIFSGPVVADRLPGKMLEQKIDDKGKAYMFKMELELEGNKLIYTVVTEPTRPYNVISYQGDVVRCSAASAMKLFGKPSSHSRRRYVVDGKVKSTVDGYWYTVASRNRGFYVPLTARSKTSGKEIYKSPIVSNSDSIVEKRSKFTRDVLFIKELLRYMYYHAKSSGYIWFWNNKIRVDNTGYKGDGSDYYDFSRVTRELPETHTLHDAMSVVYEWKTCLVQKDGDQLVIVAYDSKLRDKLKYALREISMSLRAEQQQPTYIRGYYSKSDDYIKRLNETVFHTSDELTNWKISTIISTREEGSRKEYSLITWELSDRVLPYILRHENTYFLVQNTFHTTQAEYVCKVWRDAGYNPGYFATGRTKEKADIYCIDSKGEIVLVEKADSETPLRVLYYGSPVSYRNGVEKNKGALLLLNPSG